MRAIVAARTAGDPELRESVERLLSQNEPTGAEAAAGSAEAPELAPGTTFGHYRIDAVLGHGGMGVVYRATDLKLNRSVAVKFLSALLADAQARRRFAQEAETASALNHPHIVTVLDVGEHDGRQYMSASSSTAGRCKTVDGARRGCDRASSLDRRRRRYGQRERAASRREAGNILLVQQRLREACGLRRLRSYPRIPTAICPHAANRSSTRYDSQERLSRYRLRMVASAGRALSDGTIEDVVLL